MSQNPSADVKTILDIVDSNTGVNFDSNGVRRSIECMQSFGIDVQQEIFNIRYKESEYRIQKHIQLQDRQQSTNALCDKKTKTKR